MNQVYKLHLHLIKTGHLHRLSSLRRLLLLSSAASPSYTLSIFDHILSPDAFSYNILIKCFAQHDPSISLSLFSQMRSSGVLPDNYTFPFLLKACSRLQLGLHFHSLIFKLGFDTDVYVRNSLISFHGCCGFVDYAFWVFDEMTVKDVVSWSSMITCLVSNGFGLEAVSLFQQMQLEGSVEPDEVTMVSVVTGVASLGGLALGRWAHRYVKRRGMDLTVALGTALINMYSRCGSIEESIAVFNEMSTKNVLTWTALISGLAVYGRGGEALQAFHKMKKCGVQPDHITLTGVLMACSHSGLIDEGRRIFNSIRDECRMEPTPEHYGCMVDLLGRAGLLNEAHEFLEKMPFKPNPVMWRTLLGACASHSHIEMAEKVKEKINELDPHHDGDHVLLSNAYGVAGRWSEKAGVRYTMREKRISKKPGYSVINMDQEVHQFVAGDASHPQSEEIRKFLVSIIGKLRIAGYMPITSNSMFDVDEEEKEHSLGYHSEKLAVAFALLTLKDKRAIRIIKNLRICQDCHSFMKHVSNMFEREILVRDQNRFHHFSEGVCSCRNYW